MKVRTLKPLLDLMSHYALKMPHLAQSEGDMGHGATSDDRNYRLVFCMQLHTFVDVDRWRLNLPKIFSFIPSMSEGLLIVIALQSPLLLFA